MKRIIFGLMLALVTSVGWAADAGFSQTLTPEDFRAAGLEHLSPAERAHLDALVAAFKQRLTAEAHQAAADVRVAQEKAEAALAAQRAAEAAALAAKKEAEVAKAEAQAQVQKAEAADHKGSDKGFFAKAKVLIVPGTQIEYAEISSTIEGTFEGWTGRTVFRLANGQRWQVANSDERYFVPPEKNVAVQIRPAALGGYWMFFPTFDKRVRVKLLGGK